MHMFLKFTGALEGTFNVTPSVVIFRVVIFRIRMRRGSWDGEKREISVKASN